MKNDDVVRGSPIYRAGTARFKGRSLAAAHLINEPWTVTILLIFNWMHAHTHPLPVIQFASGDRVSPIQNTNAATLAQNLSLIYWYRYSSVCECAYISAAVTSKSIWLSFRPIYCPYIRFKYLRTAAWGTRSGATQSQYTRGGGGHKEVDIHPPSHSHPSRWSKYDIMNGKQSGGGSRERKREKGERERKESAAENLNGLQNKWNWIVQ